MLVMMPVTPYDALHRLRSMREDGELDAFCERHGLDLLVVHGSVLTEEPLRPAADLDGRGSTKEQRGHRRCDRLHHRRKCGSAGAGNLLRVSATGRELRLQPRAALLIDRLCLPL